MESVVYDARSSQKFVGCCDIELAWSQDMVKNGFVYLVAEKSATEINDGYRCIVQVDIVDR